MIALGLCQCGCGQPTAVPTRTDRRKGAVKGVPRRFICGHNMRRAGAAHPNWREGRHVSDGYVFVMAPDHPQAKSRPYVFEHVLVAERALGKHLPEEAVVHHVNSDRADNRPQNLVVCQDHAYHRLIHQRLRALRACGHPDWLKCGYCKTWDERSALYVRPGRDEGYHRRCARRYMREWSGQAQ